MSKEQAEVAEMLISENPLVWNLQDIASLFNLTYNSVSKLNVGINILHSFNIGFTFIIIISFQFAHYIATTLY